MISTAKLLTVSVALMTGAIFHSSAVGAGRASTVLTPMQLIAAAQARSGQMITVVGYFTWRTDTRALWQDRDAYLDAEHERRGDKFDYWAKCVTIYQRDARAREFSDRLVRITGKVVIVRDDDERSLWTCNRVALEDAVITTR
ncbi:MAG TPA: hypothetical protein VHS33_11295 [Sphingomicrobium sp.]|jgi:hypothetical protein|nr:hypothetical protein [Sphingomicrobium sp.]